MKLAQCNKNTYHCHTHTHTHTHTTNTHTNTAGTRHPLSVESLSAVGDSLLLRVTGGVI